MKFDAESVKRAGYDKSAVVLSFLFFSFSNFQRNLLFFLDFLFNKKFRIKKKSNFEICQIFETQLFSSFSTFIKSKPAPQKRPPLPKEQKTRKKIQCVGRGKPPSRKSKIVPPIRDTRPVSQVHDVSEIRNPD